MLKFRYLLLPLIILLQGCMGGIWSGANLIYDRHNIYKKFSDYSLSSDTNRILFADKVLKQSGCSLDVAIFNGDILIAGHLPTPELYEITLKRISLLSNYRHLYKKIRISQGDYGLNDTWTTAKIRSQIIADADIDPNLFKVVTVDGIVYLMGDVPASQADRVINIARDTSGVEKVIKLLHCYYFKKPAKKSIKI